MKNILIIGGTRNIGYYLTGRLIDAGHRVTLLNRGVTPEDLPESVHRLRCDRTDTVQMKRALGGRTFDAVVDTTIYREAEAETITELLQGATDHYIAISTGQVYLVRAGLQRPYREADYDGALIPTPEPNTYDFAEYQYGVEKRAVEDILCNAYEANGFPYTTLRLPMVNSERDGFYRLYGYMLRIEDGAPILIPGAPDYPLRHIYGGDVVTAIVKLIDSGIGKGRAYNIAQDETLSLTDFLGVLGDVVGKAPIIKTYPRDLLEAQGFLPDCSPFSDTWMSELDNTRSKAELGMTYTPLHAYVERIVAHYRDHPVDPIPRSYRRRHAEKAFAEDNSGSTKTNADDFAADA